MPRAFPILQLGISSKTLSEQQIMTIWGTTSFEPTSPRCKALPVLDIPNAGGKNRSVMVDLNLDEL